MGGGATAPATHDAGRVGRLEQPAEAALTSLAFRTWGPPDGDVAVLVHGVTSSSRTWHRVGPLLEAEGWRVIAVDLRGHGASSGRAGGTAPRLGAGGTAPRLGAGGTAPRLSVGVTLDDLADDVVRTVAAVVRPDADAGADPSRGAGAVNLLLGHSLGALVALNLAARHQEFARRVAVEDPPGARSVDWRLLADDIVAEAELARRDPAGFRRSVDTGDPVELERKLADVLDCDSDEVAEVLRHGAFSPASVDPVELVARVRAPLLVIAGEELRGSALRGADREALAAAIDARRTAGSTFITAPAGHNVHREDFGPFMGSLLGWLRA